MIDIVILKRGETIDGIAKKIGYPVEAILHLNNMTKADRVKVGCELKVPKRITITHKEQIHCYEPDAKAIEKTLERNRIAYEKCRSIVQTVHIAVHVNVAHDSHIAAQAIAVAVAVACVSGIPCSSREKAYI